MSIAVRDEGRSPSLRKRKFYARYMTWLERVGYTVVLVVIGGFVYAFTARVDDVISADGVELAPAFAAVEATGPTLVVRRLVPDGTEVAKGAPLLEIVEGEANVTAYRRWAAATELNDASLLARNPKPPTRVIAASRAGTFRSTIPPAGPLFSPMSFAPKAEIARVVDFNEIHAQASLAGDTATRAVAGGEARVINLAFPNPAGVTLRATSGEKAPAIASRDLLGPDLRAEIERALVGATVRVKNDTLKVGKVNDIQVDARLQTKAGTGGTPLDLAGGTTLRARVLSGSAVATAQLIDLPGPLANLVRARVASLAGREILTPQGASLRIVRADETGILVKIKADGLADATGSTLDATPLKTTFDADVQIDSPSPALIRALRDADRAGKPVTARVELVTGTRPLAFLLLKRS